LPNSLRKAMCPLRRSCPFLAEVKAQARARMTRTGGPIDLLERLKQLGLVLPVDADARSVKFATFSTCGLFMDILRGPPVCGEWRRGAISATKCFTDKDFCTRQRGDQKWRVASTPPP
jgi:hypothetical protein